MYHRWVALSRIRIVIAPIELIQAAFGTWLSKIIHAQGKHFTDASGTLALEMQLSLSVAPVDKIGAASGSWVAHVAKGEHGKDRLVLRVVVALERAIDEHLYECDQRQQAEELDQILLDEKVVLDAYTIAEENLIIPSLLFVCFLLLLGLFYLFWRLTLLLFSGISFEFFVL